MIFNAATEVISPKAIFSINVAIYTSTTTTGLINSCSGRAVNWAIRRLYQRQALKIKTSSTVDNLRHNAIHRTPQIQFVSEHAMHWNLFEAVLRFAW